MSEKEQISESKILADITQLSFEKAIEKLEKIVEALEGGNVQLAESIELFEQGEKLKVHCSKLLHNAQMKIQKIKTDSNNKPIGVEDIEEG